MNKYYEQINEFIQESKNKMIADWAMLVNMEGHYDEKENVERAILWLKNEFEKEGMKCYVKDVMAERAGILIGILGEERSGKPVILSGHIDTVHPSGAFGSQNPFRIEDGKAYGPGVLDMKGGIIIALYIVKALNKIGYDERPIKIMFAGEEESDHVGNDADKIFENQSKGAVCAFNLETGHIENRLCVGRKTQYTYFVKVKGLGGHAGNEFEKGRNAIVESVYKINDLVKLTDLGEGTTITPSVINSGSLTNTSSIPDQADFVVDVRVKSTEIGEQVREAIDNILKTDFIPGTETEYFVNFAKLHPFSPNEKIMKFFNFINKIACENGYEPFGQIELGGATDAGSIAASGIPVLCSCGVIGEYNHNLREYAVVQSLFSRTKIFATAITELSEMERV